MRERTRPLLPQRQEQVRQATLSTGSLDDVWSKKAERRATSMPRLDAAMLPHLAVTAPAVEVATVEASMMEVSAAAE
jgi:hypothetical protein